jgi:fucose permease
LVAAGFVTSIGTSSVVAGLNTYFAISQSARLMNWLQACFGLGATLSPALIARLLELGGSWRWGFAIVFLSMGALAVGFGYTRKQWHLVASETSGEGTDRPGKVRSADTLRFVAVWLSLLLFFVFTGLEGTAGQWPYTLFTEGRGISPRTAGLWVSVFWLSMTIGRIVFGIVVDRVGAVPLIRGAMGGVILGTGLIWWRLSDISSFLGLALVGFAASPIFPVLTSDTPERVGHRHAANAIGFQLASSRLGLAAIPALAGVLAAALGLEIIGPFLFAVAVAQFLVHEVTLVKRAQPSSLR